MDTLTVTDKKVIKKDFYEEAENNYRLCSDCSGLISMVQELKERFTLSGIEFCYAVLREYIAKDTDYIRFVSSLPYNISAEISLSDRKELNNYSSLMVDLCDRMKACVAFFRALYFPECKEDQYKAYRDMMIDRILDILNDDFERDAFYNLVVFSHAHDFLMYCIASKNGKNYGINYQNNFKDSYKRFLRREGIFPSHKRFLKNKISEDKYIRLFEDCCDFIVQHPYYFREEVQIGAMIASPVMFDGSYITMDPKHLNDYIKTCCSKPAASKKLQECIVTIARNMPLDSEAFELFMEKLDDTGISLDLSVDVNE